MELAGYLASFLVGISLGLVGGGGSILMVPVLVYLFGITPVSATAYSLFVVGATSLVGAIPKIKQDLVSFRTALIFGAPSIVAVFLTRKYLVPAIPDVVLRWDPILVTRSTFLMLLFGIIMTAAAVSMLTGRECVDCDENEQQRFRVPLIVLEGILVGTLTGLVGAGGGFLIIPALVKLSKLSMKKAVGTSLVIIAAKSLIGFSGDVHAGAATIDYRLLVSVTALAVLGILAGNGVSKKVDGEKLKRGFGWMVLIMGIYIVIAEANGL